MLGHMKIGVAYKLTFPNGKVYIGITSESLARRVKRHIAYAKAGKQYALSCAIRKYGVESFMREVIGVGTWSELQAIEIAMIAQYGSFGSYGYNMTAGGEGSLGVVRSEATRKKIGAAMSKILSGRTLSDEHKKRVGDAFRGKPLSEATKKKMSVAKSDKSRGPMSEEQKQKIRESLRGRPQSAERIAKRVEARRSNNSY